MTSVWVDQPWGHRTSSHDIKTRKTKHNGAVLADWPIINWAAGEFLAQRRQGAKTQGRIRHGHLLRLCDACLL